MSEFLIVALALGAAWVLYDRIAHGPWVADAPDDADLDGPTLLPLRRVARRVDREHAGGRG